MSRAARRAYAYAALIASSFYAVWWGLDLRIAVAVALMAALALVMLAHSELAKGCRRVVYRDALGSSFACVLAARHGGACTTYHGVTRKEVSRY